MARPCWKCGATLVPPAQPTVSSPDLTRLMTSNEAPLDSEIRSVHMLIADGRRQVDELDTEVADLQVILAQLVRKRDKTVDRICQYNVVFAPLLCEIFALTLSGGNEAERPPWYLGQICRSWRFLALTYPSLWNSITIPNSTHSMVAMIETQLFRSANALLTVRWSQSASVRDSRPMDPHSRDAVLANCSRWGALRLNLEDIPVDLEWLRPVAGRLTALKKFDLIGLNSDSKSPTFFWERQICHSSPEIVVRNVPWVQLTHFRGAYDTETLCHILAAASKLVHCAVSLQIDPGPRTPIAAQCLRRLSINSAACLVHLTAPLLEELYIGYTLAPVVILHSLHRSSCSLKTLILKNCAMTSDLITVLRSISALTFLLLDDCRNANSDVVSLWEAMTITETPRDICPNLSSLVVGFNRDYFSSLFLTMAHSRLRPSPPNSHLERLRFFRGFGCPNSIYQIKDRVRQLRNEGFDVALLGPDEYRLWTTQGFVLGTSYRLARIEPRLQGPNFSLSSLLFAQPE
ncbi:hypothetical protein DFH06DRAFT_1144981 [Mycena polygramma]|nr:hypothetical protein DFH06DRAFT_1144981 [Mycena polygramma]